MAGAREAKHTAEYRKLVDNRPTETTAAGRIKDEGIGRHFRNISPPAQNIEIHKVEIPVKKQRAEQRPHNEILKYTNIEILTFPKIQISTNLQRKRQSKDGRMDKKLGGWGAYQ